MKIAVENYVSQTDAAASRTAFAAWSLLALVVAAWVGLIVAAPVLRANNFDAAASWIYWICSYLCHQIAARSFHVENEPLAVCARCFGVYFGLAVGVLIYPLLRRLDDLEPLPRVWLLLSPLPTTVDFLLGWFGIWHNTHFSRFTTAAILGLGCAFFLIPGVISLFIYRTANER